MKTAVKLVILSLLVGMLLAALGVTLGNFWPSVLTLFGNIVNAVVRFFDWGGEFIILGALVVLPVYIYREVARRRRQRSE